MIAYLTRHPTGANLLMLAFFMVGFMTYPHLLRATMPRIEASKIQVSIAYPGARPEDIEEAVCRRVEDAIDTVSNVLEQKCEAQENIAIATIEMTEGTDLNEFLDDIKTEIEAITDFPDQVEQPIIRKLGLVDFVAAVSIVGPKKPSELKAYAEKVKLRMKQWGNIPKIQINGFSDHQIRIELSEQVLQQYSLSISDITSAISSQSLDLAAGTIKTQQQSILIRYADQRKTVHDFQNLIVVTGADGGQIRLGDMATITDRFEDEENKIVIDGMRAAQLIIEKTPNDDTLKTIDAVKSFITKENQTNPSNVKLILSRDNSSIVRDRLELLTKNGMQGLMLVFVVMWFFFGIKYAAWITAGLPVSFMGGFAVMMMLGMTINMLTMIGLLIVIGLLMDDAIVIAENIAAHWERGDAPMDAAINGASNVLSGVLSSFTTTALLFGSLMFMQGELGQIIRVVPIVMLAVLTVSIVEAFLILPAHLGHSLPKEHKDTSWRKTMSQKFIHVLRDILFMPAVRAAVNYRYLTVGITVAALILAISAMAGGIVKFSAFPKLDGNVIEARILLPQGTPLAKTEAIATHIEEAIKDVGKKLDPQQPDNKKLIRNTTIIYNQNVDAHEAGTHVATVIVDLLSAEERVGTTDDINDLWRQKVGSLPDVIAIKFAESVYGPGGLAIDLRLVGNDLPALKKASTEFIGWLRQYKGVYNLMDDLRPGKLEYQVKLKEGAKNIGINATMVADQLRKSFFGSVIDEIQNGPENYEIDVRLSLKNRDSLDDLDYFRITTPEGRLVPLSTVATLVQDRGYSRINHVNGIRAVTITGDVNKRIANINEVLAHTKKEFLPDFLKRHPAVKLDIQGQEKETAKTQSSMLSGFLFGLACVFLMLSFQFRSYVEPLVIMIVIPFSLIGAIIGHIIMQIDFTMPSMFGFFALSGIVVNDSILLVNYLKDHHGKGATVIEAAPIAAQARFRAIFLTSLTTFAGLFPILTETSEQAQILIPIVTSLAFGLVSATFLVLFFVPALYAIFDDVGFTTLARDRKEKLAEANA